MSPWDSLTQRDPKMIKLISFDRLRVAFLRVTILLIEPLIRAILIRPYCA